MTGYGLMGVTIVIQLVLVPLYLTHLGKEKFGILAMIMAANNYAAIGITWLSGGMARILAERAAVEDIEGFKAGYAFAKWLYVAYAVLAVTLFWIVAPWLLPKAIENKEIVIALALASLYLILLYEYNADRAAFNARHWQAKGNLRELIGQVFFATGVLIGLFAGWGLPGVIAAQVVGILTTRALAWYFWRQDAWRLAWMKPVADFKGLWQRVSGKMGRDYVIYGVLLLTLQADVLLLGWLTDPETVASYYLLWRMPEVVILLLWRIPGSYGPFLIAMDAREEHQALQKNYQRGLYLMIGVAGFAAVIYGLAGQYIVSMWVGENAPLGYIPYALAASAMFFLAVARWPSGIAYSLVNTQPLIRVAAVELSAKWILFLLLFADFGYFTPMLATTIVHCLLVFYLYLWLGRNTISTTRWHKNAV
ncbi:MAG: hypothetical protein ABS93_00520 [Thiobacillus sp. SCN 62-729]|nr:MAG: hypothetical protein ABS93_00520 [Thiobacillus sp. SCN 62-729]